MINDAADELLDVDGGGYVDVGGGGVGVGVDGGGVGVDGGGVGVDGGGVGLGVCVRVGAGELLCCGEGVGEGADAVGRPWAGDVLFAGSCAARLLAAVLLVADGAGPLVAEPAPDPSVLCGFAPVRPAGRPGAGVLPPLGIVTGDAAE